MFYGRVVEERNYAVKRLLKKEPDYGLMQINLIHFNRLSVWGINERNILNPQINIFAGSWLLSEHIKERGFNLQAIGNYHSKTQVYKEKWLHRLIVVLKTSPNS